MEPLSHPTHAVDDKDLPVVGDEKAVDVEAPAETPNQPPNDKFTGDAWFWASFAGLCLSAMISALDTSVFATALPTIVRDLGSGSDYVWALDIYFLTTAVVQPAFGQFSDMYGRKWLMVLSTILFLVGSGISGGARNTATLIGGRGVQGLGNGGICTLVEIIISDQVPLKDRANFFGLIFAVISVGTSFGPFVGGALAQHATWRWVFWLNFPVGGLSLVLLLIFLKETRDKNAPSSQRLGITSIDWIGNLIITGSTIAITFALARGGASHPWSSGKVLAPLIVGLVTLPLFALYESSGLCKNPLMPIRFFHNLSTSIVLSTTFLSTMLLMWLYYFYPFFFQAVQSSSPTRTGVQLLPLSLSFPITCMVGGALLGKLGQYKVMHIFSMALLTICFGCSALLSPHSNDAAWIFLELGLSIGFGGLMATLLPALQASLSDQDTAPGVAIWAYLRTLGSFWGVTIPAAIFTNRFDQHIDSIGDPAWRARLSGGQAYKSASKELVESINNPRVRQQVINLYTTSLRWSWYISVIFAGMAFFLCVVQKQYPLKGAPAAPEKESDAESNANTEEQNDEREK